MGSRPCFCGRLDKDIQRPQKPGLLASEGCWPPNVGLLTLLSSLTETYPQSQGAGVSQGNPQLMQQHIEQSQMPRGFGSSDSALSSFDRLSPNKQVSEEPGEPFPSHKTWYNVTSVGLEKGRINSVALFPECWWPPTLAVSCKLY